MEESLPAELPLAEVHWMRNLCSWLQEPFTPLVAADGLSVLGPAGARPSLAERSGWGDTRLGCGAGGKN